MSTSTTTEMTAPRGGSGEMFDRIARRYDMLNRILSLGMDQGWRKKTVRALELSGGERVLDLATGTADLAIRVARTHPDVTVVGLDPSVRMLEVGRRKLDKLALADRVELVTGDAESLPHDTNSFDAITMAFGIRNVPDRAKALREMARVVRPQGRIAILELNEPQRGFMAGLARFHMRVLVPRLGALLSGAREYRYLQQSVAAFPPPEEFARMMESAGIEMLRSRGLTFGVCQLYLGRVIG